LDKPTLVVRPATDRDRGEIIRLLGEYRLKTSDRRGARDFLDSSPLAEHEAGAKSHEDVQVLLCHQGEDLVGVGALEIRVVGSTPRALLEIFCSDDSILARDVVQLLIETGESVALTKEVGDMDIMALPGDQRLKSSLEERGYRARLLVMNRSLRTP